MFSFNKMLVVILSLTVISATQCGADDARRQLSRANGIEGVELTQEAKEQACMNSKRVTRYINVLLATAAATGANYWLGGHDIFTKIGSLCTLTCLFWVESAKGRAIEKAKQRKLEELTRTS